MDSLLNGRPEADLAARGRLLRGLARQRQKQFDQAAKDLEAFLEAGRADDEAADARYALALCRIQLKQFGQAAAALAELARQKPGYPHADEAYYELGHACLQDGRAAEAAQAFHALAEKLPQSPLAAEAWFQVGRRHEEAADRASAENERTSELAKAGKAYAAGLLRAKDAELKEKLQYKLADVEFRQKRFDQAAAALQGLLRERPRGSLAGPARFLAAECLLRQEKFAEALPLYAQVAEEKVQPYQPRALYRAGACAANQKKWAESQKYYETLVRDFPRFEQLDEARYGLAVALQNQARLDEARRLFQQAAKAGPAETAAKARFMLGEIAFAERKFEDAIEQYLMVTSGYAYKHWQALAQFEIGRCFLSLGKRAQAIEAFQTVVGKYHDHPKAQDAARMLTELK